MSQKIKLFIIECVDPMDLVSGKSEAKALEKVCKMFGHRVAILTAHSSSDFRKYCQYISSIDSAHDEPDLDTPLFVHISAHGNSDGVGFGSDFLSWREMSQAMQPLFSQMINYEGDIYLSISSCEAGEQRLNRHIERDWRHSGDVNPPSYIFTTSESGGVTWEKAVVAWTVFYHRFSELDTVRPLYIKRILKDICSCVDTGLTYFRWARRREKYLYFNGRSSALTRQSR